MKTSGEIEAAISEGIRRFEQEYMGRGPKDIRAHLVDDLVMVRLQGVLTAAEQHFLVAQQANPSLVAPYTYLAGIYSRRQGRHAEAEAMLRQALFYDPLSPGLLFDIQGVLELQGRHLEAHRKRRRPAGPLPGSARSGAHQGGRR